MRTVTSTAVVEVSKMYRASSKAAVESALSRRPGVLCVDVTPLAQTATVIAVTVWGPFWHLWIAPVPVRGTR